MTNYKIQMTKNLNDPNPKPGDALGNDVIQ